MAQKSKTFNSFGRSNKRDIEFNFAGGNITGDAGVLLLEKVMQELPIIKSITNVIVDNRQSGKTKHSFETIIKQRIIALGIGHEDINDHDILKNCHLIQSAAGKDKPLASSSTICRVENNMDRSSAVEIHKAIFDNFIKGKKTPPKSITLDFDATDDLIHGNQEGKFYHGYYNNYCFLPLYVFCGSELLVSYLRPSSKDQALHAGAILSLLVKGIRKEWPDTEIIFRADSGFNRAKILSWCDRNNVKYCIGMAQNSRLNNILDPLLQEAEQSYKTTKERQRAFQEFQYKPSSWVNTRKIVGKAEVTENVRNPRYIVTSIEGDPKNIYDSIYCARGDMENRIKEQQLELFADRTSASKWWSNQYRLLLSSLAYIFINYIREKYLKGTKLAKAQVGTIRLKLLKVGAIVIRNTRKLKILISSTYPYKELWHSVARKMMLA